MTNPITTVTGLHQELGREQLLRGQGIDPARARRRSSPRPNGLCPEMRGGAVPCDFYSKRGYCRWRRESPAAAAGAQAEAQQTSRSSGIPFTLHLLGRVPTLRPSSVYR